MLTLVTPVGHRDIALLAIAAAVLLPLFLAPAGSVMGNLVLAAAYVGMALGLNVIVGFAGLLDLGYVAFFAIGAYTAGYFGSGYWHETDGQRPGRRARAACPAST